VEIYPEKETPCPEPPFAAKYPNSRNVVCTEKNKKFLFVYVSKDKAEDIYDYYRDRLKAHYKEVGVNIPERFWKTSDEFGIQISHTEVDGWGEYLEAEKKNKHIESPPPKNGVVFHIVIDKGSPASFIEDYSFIRVYYYTDPQVIKKKIDDIKWLYPQ
jgi:hypothetical protein